MTLQPERELKTARLSDRTEDLGSDFFEESCTVSVNPLMPTPSLLCASGGQEGLVPGAPFGKSQCFLAAPQKAL